MLNIMKRICIPALPVIILFVIFNQSCTQKNVSESRNESISIEKYLDNHLMQPAFGGRVLSAHKILLQQDNNIFIWAFLQEYYKKDGKTNIGSAWSVPLVLNIENTSTEMIIKSHTSPGDGELYAKDIKRLFPSNIQQEIFDFPGTQEMRELEEYSKKRSERL